MLLRWTQTNIIASRVNTYYKVHNIDYECRFQYFCICSLSRINSYKPYWYFCFPGVTTHCGCIFHNPVEGFSLLIFDVSRSHTTTRHSRYDSSGRVINPSPRPLPDNTQHSQQTNIHAFGGIQTHDRSRRAAVDLRLRPRGYWDRQTVLVYHWFQSPNHILWRIEIWHFVIT